MTDPIVFYAESMLRHNFPLDGEYKDDITQEAICIAQALWAERNGL